MNSIKRIRIKICGMTRPQDVIAAVDLGVDAIGVILHADSPRQIDVAIAKEVRACVPAFVSLVGVFVNAESDQINQAVTEIGLDLVQLHGNEDEAFASTINVPYVKAIRAKDRQSVERQIEQFSSARALLLDTYVKGQHGGTGVQFDSTLWPQSATRPLIMAGGLSASNVVAACAASMPYAIDLNSGVESALGIKDAALMADAVDAVRTI